MSQGDKMIEKPDDTYFLGGGGYILSLNLPIIQTTDNSK